jgi:hypothetical protein
MVTLVEVIVDNQFCTVDDPSTAGCPHWEAGPILGDSTGIATAAVIG